MPDRKPLMHLDASDPMAWGLPPTQEQLRLPGRAAGFVWTLAVVQLLLFGCLATILRVVAVIPLEQLLEQLPEHQHEAAGALQQGAGAVSLAVVILGVVPGVVYLLCGFGVKRKNNTAITIALIVGWAQLLIVGLILLSNIAGAARMGNPAAISLNLLVLGTLAGLLWYTTRLLLQLRRMTAMSPYPLQSDPWNTPHG